MASDVRVIVRYKPNRPGVGAVGMSGAVGDATKDIAERAKFFAEQIAPEETGNYARSFEVDTYVETEVGYPYPSPRRSARLVNTARHAIIVELGAPNTRQYAILRATLEYLDKTYMSSRPRR